MIKEFKIDYCLSLSKWTKAERILNAELRDLQEFIKYWDPITEYKLHEKLLMYADMVFSECGKSTQSICELTVTQPDPNTFLIETHRHNTEYHAKLCLITFES